MRDGREQMSVTVQGCLRNVVLLWAQEENEVALSMPQLKRAAQILSAPDICLKYSISKCISNMWSKSTKYLLMALVSLIKAEP